MAPMTGKVVKDWKVDPVSSADLLIQWSGKSVLVIGGTSGLGQALARESVASGAASVTVVGRTFKEPVASTTVEANTDAPKSATIQFVKADLSLMTEAKRIGETITPTDVVVFTNGIIAASKRQESAEGIEMDMAVSYLSRIVILKYLTPRLKAGSRVFVMGFPGGNVPAKNLDDWNAEKTYSGGFGTTHMNTVAGNEALVLDYASKKNGNLYFGLNPGLIKTGIRGNMYMSGVMSYVGPVMEWILGLLSPPPESYAKVIAPLFVSPTLDAHNGSMFNPKAQPVEPSAVLIEEDSKMVGQIMAASAAVIKTKTGIDVIV